MLKTDRPKMTHEQAAVWLATYGSPLFYLDEAGFKDRAQLLLYSACKAGLDADFFYSYKTNSLTALCELAFDAGFGAEVVSSSELKHAIHLGLPSDRIIFNGPYKPLDALVLAIQKGILIHADSIQELLEISRQATILGMPARVGVRLQFDFGMASWSKFGVDPIELYDYLESYNLPDNLDLCGAHIHVGTNITELGIFQHAIRQLLQAVNTLESKFSQQMQYIDVGGGLAAGGAVPLDVLPGEWLLPHPEQYFEIIAEEIHREGGSSRKVIFEPGRLLVASCMHLICKIVGVKEIRGRKLVITDGNINHIPSAYYLKHQVLGLVEGQRHVKADLFGPLCTQFDCLGLDIELPDPHLGDPLLICDVGAYCLTFSNQFAFPRPAVIMVSDSGPPQVVRMREQEDHFWYHDISPGSGR